MTTHREPTQTEVLPRGRPYLNAGDYVWNETPGIALWDRSGTIQAHLTYAQARRMADRLHDLCDAAGNPEPELPATDAEQEA
jgi:hypothetical protein